MEKSQKKYIDEIKLSCYNKADSALCWIFSENDLRHMAKITDMEESP
jgi:hypothetical protein